MIERPTDIQLVWGTRAQSLSSRFQARVAVIESLLSRWTKPSQTAIDVSGGAGRWLPTLAPRFRKFWHMDLSRPALAFAQQENPTLTHVEYGCLDLMTGECDPARQETPDVLFCLDTLLYEGAFVETAVRNFHRLLGPQSIAILEVPSKLRWQVSRRVKGKRYNGPTRAFSAGELRRLLGTLGYECLEMAFQYSEIPPGVHRTLSRVGLTRLVPIPSTWAYVVIRPTPMVSGGP